MSPDGDDAAPGTVSRPLATIGEALSRVESGGAVAVRAGVYREALGDVSKRVTLAAFECEHVRLRGSVVVTGWQRLERRVGGPVWSVDWPHAFCADCVDPGNVVAEHPHAGLPDQVFVDGEPLAQVVRPSDVRDGSFQVSEGRLVVGTDPEGRRVEAVVHANALRLRAGAEGSMVRGITFEHFSPTAEPGLGGMVIGDAVRLVFERNTFRWSAVKGLSIFKPGARVKGNVFENNGMMGLEAWRADGLVVRSNTFRGNNREGFAVTGEVSEAAGAKITETGEPVVSDNRFVANLANGLWLDIDVVGARVERNLMEGNTRHGLFHEISTGGLIEGNVVTGSGAAGIAIADSTNVRVTGNVLSDNGIGLLVQDDARTRTDARAAAAGLTWATAGLVFENNTVVGDGPLVWVRDYTTRLAPDDMIERMKGNVFSLGRGPFAQTWEAGERRTFETEAGFRSANVFAR